MGRNPIQGSGGVGGGVPTGFPNDVPVLRQLHYEDFQQITAVAGSALRDLYEFSFVNGNVSFVASVPNGILFFRADSGTAGNGAVMTSGAGATTNVTIASTKNSEVKFSGGFGSLLDNPIDNLTVLLGIIQGESVPGTSLAIIEGDIQGGSWFRLDTLTDANWQAVSRFIDSGGSIQTTVIDTGVAPAQEQYQDFEITLDGTTVKWFIGGSEVASSTSAYPKNNEAGNPPDFFMNFLCNTTTRNTVQKFFRLDYFYLLTDRVGFIDGL